MLGKLFYTLHLLAAVFWVGGMAFALLTLRPAVAVLEPPQRLALHGSVFARFLRLIWHLLPTLLVTGYVLLFGYYGGFKGAGWHIHTMHLLALIMSGVFLALVFGPWRGFQRAMAAGDAPAAAAAAGRMRQFVAVNLGLGVLTVAIAAWGRFGG